MKKTLLLCLALLFPINIHCKDRDFFELISKSILYIAGSCVIYNSIEIVAKEKTQQEIQKTQQEIQKTQQEIQKTKQLNLTIAIKKQILLNKE